MVVDENAGSGEVYTAPKFSEMEFLDQLTKEEKKKERAKKRILQSEMMDYIRESVDDRPEELKQLGSFDLRDKESIRREQFEEDNFIRLHLSKKEQNQDKGKSFKDDTLQVTLINNTNFSN